MVYCINANDLSRRHSFRAFYFQESLLFRSGTITASFPKTEGADMSFSHLFCDRDLLIEHINEAEKLLETSRKYIYSSRDQNRGRGLYYEKYTDVR